MGIALGGSAQAAPELIFEILDPSGDDHGDGSLIYPYRRDLRDGDLDLARFAAYSGKKETIFRVTFARPIRAPVDGEVLDGLGTSLADLARLGFYQFNVDIYIDIDRKPDSGNVEMLPGRKAEVDARHAWDRAIIATPRPNMARDSLERWYVRQFKRTDGRPRRVGREEVRAERARIRERLDREVHHVRKTNVRGTTLEFSVPDRFLGRQALPEWSYVVVITGADLVQRVVVPVVGISSVENTLGMVLPIYNGASTFAFGGARRDDPFQPPIVDLLAPGGRRQEDILLDYDLRVHRVRVPGIVPFDELVREKSAASE